MSIKKDETYFRQYINNIFTLPNSDTKYALADVKKIGKTFYYVYIGFENHSSDEPCMEECKTLLKIIKQMEIPLDKTCEECNKLCSLTKNSEHNKLSCPECYHKSNCQSCDECGVDVYWEHAKKKNDIRVCEDCYNQE